MLWLYLALFAAAAFGITSIVDKLAVSRFFRSPWAYYCWWAAYSVALSLLFLLFAQWPPQFNAFAFAAGMVSAVVGAIYLGAIGREDVSRVIPLFFLSPLFVLLLSSLFLGESLAGEKYAGIVVLVSGAVLMGVREPHRLRLGRGAKLAVLAAAVAGVSTIFYKVATGAGGLPEVLFWNWLGYGVAGILIAHGHFGEFFREFPALGARRIGVLLSMVVVTVAAFAAITWAYSMQSASLVSAVNASQPFFTFLYALAASFFIPKLLKEETGAKTVAFKLIGGLLIIIGVYLVS